MPAYNESPVLADTIDGLLKYVRPANIVVVDDGSDDGTGKTAAARNVTVLRHLINRGQGAAIVTGIRAALKLGADIIVTFDADGQHNPDDLPAMIEPVRNGEADVVLGSRFIGQTGNIPRLRRFTLRAGVFVTRIISRIRVSDTHNGFRVLSAAAAGRIKISQDGMAHASEFIDQVKINGLRFTERAVRISYTSYSLAKGQRNSDFFKVALRILLYKIFSS